MKLYKIWRVGGDYTYPLERILSVITYTRDQVISTDLEKLNRICDKLNFIKDDDEHYEIRDDDLNTVYRSQHENHRPNSLRGD